MDTRRLDEASSYLHYGCQLPQCYGLGAQWIFEEPHPGRGDTLAVCAQEPLVGFQFFGSALNKL